MFCFCISDLTSHISSFTHNLLTQFLCCLWHSWACCVMQSHPCFFCFQWSEPEKVLISTVLLSNGLLMWYIVFLDWLSIKFQHVFYKSLPADQAHVVSPLISGIYRPYISLNCVFYAVQYICHVSIKDNSYGFLPSGITQYSWELPSLQCLTYLMPHK